MSKRKEQTKCRRCGEINDNELEHKSGRRVTMCVKCWNDRNAKDTETHNKRRAAPYTHLLSERSCNQCGNTFAARASNQKFCSSVCRDLSISVWRKGQRQSLKTPINCAECGSEFVRGSGSEKYCTDACRKEVKRKSTREGFLRSRYRITPEQLDRLNQLAKNKCGICQREFNGQSSINVDHDHSCCPGEMTCGNCLRGLLCNKCNTMLGMANDSVETLNRAIRYLSP